MLIPKIVGKFKMQTSKQINILRNTVGKSVWQRNYYDHIIRNEESYNKITEYIENNPSKWEFDKYYLADIKGVKDAA
jgi:REP element-mobilizing transposase RayT